MHVVPSSPTSEESFSNFQNFPSSNFNVDKSLSQNNNYLDPNNNYFDRNFLSAPNQIRLRSPVQVVPSPSRVVSPYFDISSFDVRSPTMFSPTGSDNMSMKYSPNGFSSTTSSRMSMDFGRNIDLCRQNRLSSIDSGRTTEGSSVSPSRSSFFDEFRVEQVNNETSKKIFILFWSIISFLFLSRSGMFDWRRKAFWLNQSKLNRRFSQNMHIRPVGQTHVQFKHIIIWMWHQNPIKRAKCKSVSG